MSQNDMVIDNQGFPAFRADLNTALQALASLSSGATEPTTTFAYQFWADTANDLLKQRNAANDGWVSILTLSTGAPVGVQADKISEGNSSIEVVDTGTGYVKIIIDGVDIGRMKSSLSSLSIGSGDTGLIFYDDATQERVLPWNLSTGSVKDGLVNLGQGNSRFKDIYLSGGVYLGGTGAANYLDDYEEGTFTITGTEVASGSGLYQRIGQHIYVTGFFSITNNSNATAATFGGLPFAAGGSAEKRGGFAITYQNKGLSDVSILPNTSASSFVVRINGVTGATWANMSSGSFYFSGIYTTEA